MSIKITSWNINSIKARHDHVKRYLTEYAPDVLFMQELKGLDFPSDMFESAGYQTHAVTQKSYNGVAIASKHPIHVHNTKLPGYEEDEQSRYIEADINGLRMINIYLPNGNPAPGPKYDYKLEWMQHLYNHLKTLRDSDTAFLIGGDFNVIPEEKDCEKPKDWKGDALFRIETHRLYRSILNLGLTDALRVKNTKPKSYTFWDYQAGAWQRNNGIRIDHFLLSPILADRLKSCTINTEPRGWDRPSDHTPIEIEIDL